MNEFESPRIFDDALIQDESVVSRFIANVFSWMVAGLVVTATAAYYTVESGFIMQLFTTQPRPLMAPVSVLKSCMMKPDSTV